MSGESLTVREFTDLKVISASFVCVSVFEVVYVAMGVCVYL